MEWVHTLKHLRLPSLRLPIARKDVGLSERSYVQAEPPQTLPPVPVRVSRKSQLMAALRQHARPIVIEDPELGRPFDRLLRARGSRLWALGFVADTLSFAISRSLGADVEKNWYIGRYLLPGNVQKVVLKPKAMPFTRAASDLPQTK
jgi:hypothetical protein